jgi:hypothetical protein
MLPIMSFQRRYQLLELWPKAGTAQCGSSASLSQKKNRATLLPSKRLMTVQPEALSGGFTLAGQGLAEYG